jgi:arylsulfatase A-like enzyme
MVKQKQPNIIVVMTDQQRADSSAREGFPLDTTPFMDQLARQGVCFQRAYTAAPVCGPARVSLLTGRFPSAHHVRENRAFDAVTYTKDIIDVLQENGYATAMIGKNHSHLKRERLDHWFELSHDGGYRSQNAQTDEERAFDQWLHALNHAVSLEPTPFPLTSQGPYRAVSDAQRWITSVTQSDNENETKPFFLWLSFAEPHNPYQVPEPYFSMFPPESLPPLATDRTALEAKGFKWTFTRALGEHYYPEYESLLPRARANYYGLMRMIDDQLARLVQYLEDAQLKENTLIIFVSDHGDFVGEYGLMRKGPEMPEVLMRIPMFVVGPEVTGQKAPRIDCVSLIDVMPTICEAIGADIPQGVQGRSLWPILTGGDYPAQEFASIYAEQGYGGLHYTEEDDIDYAHCGIDGPVRDSFDELNTYSQSGILRMVRQGEWKLIYDMQGRGQLYHLAEDPYELCNLYGDPQWRSVQMALLEQLLTWSLRMQDPLPFPKHKYRIKTHPRNYWSGGHQA